eukprot:3668447-Rhodomonas_salina.1
MCRGGVSAAIAGNVSETLWKLQSGHRSVSWQHYADLVSVVSLLRGVRTVRGGRRTEWGGRGKVRRDCGRGGGLFWF